MTRSSLNDLAVSMSGIEPGTILLGKYRVDSVLGQGGMGVVVAATHIDLEQRVAIKFLLPEALDELDAVERFVREARAAARIQSEHVARVSDVGRLPNGEPYMVMEYLEGADLGKVLQANGPLPIGDAVEMVMQALSAIAQAHSLGIVHRDLKTANLFLTKRANGTHLVKVLDFGISKLLQSHTEDEPLTQTGSTLGSPNYMSPEQLRSARSVDERTDIWSMGVVLFRLLTYKHPFDADTAEGQILAIVMDPPRALRRLRPEVPRELEAIVNRCLQKDREQRFANVDSLMEALAPFASAQPLAILAGRASGTDPTTGRSLTSTVTEDLTPPRSDGTAGSMPTSHFTAPPSRATTSRMLVGIALVGLLLGGLGAWFLVMRGAPTAQPTTNNAGRSAPLSPSQVAAPSTAAAPVPSAATNRNVDSPSGVIDVSSLPPVDSATPSHESAPSRRHQDTTVSPSAPASAKPGHLIDSRY